MLERMVKLRCGIAEAVTVYDEDIEAYVKDAKADMIDSGVPPDLFGRVPDEQVVTAVTLYVKAYLGTDASDTEKYLRLYRRKVFRLTLHEAG